MAKSKHARPSRPRTTKVCKGCNTRLPLDEFGTDRSTLDKKAYKCILCMRRYYADKKKLMAAKTAKPTDNT